MGMNTREIAEEYRLSHWAGVVRERQESGLSIKAFCEKAGFHQNIYFYWQRKLREAAACGERRERQSVRSPRMGGMRERGTESERKRDMH